MSDVEATDYAGVAFAASLALPAAEQELLEWATGKRSSWNEMTDHENYVGDSSSTGPGIGPDRQESMMRTAQRDAAEIQAARERVLSLRLLAGIK